MNEDQFFYHQATPLVVQKKLNAFYLTYLISNITQNIIFEL
jgi:hypothetical protein